jgi:hypothetical protein
MDAHVRPEFQRSGDFSASFIDSPQMRKDNDEPHVVPLGNRAAVGQIRRKNRLDAFTIHTYSIVAVALSLATMRDLLLPKLMSGEIRVREAEKIAEAVL